MKHDVGFEGGCRPTGALSPVIDIYDNDLVLIPRIACNQSIKLNLAFVDVN